MKTPQRVSAILKMRPPDSVMQLMCVYRPSTNITTVNTAYLLLTNHILELCFDFNET